VVSHLGLPPAQLLFIDDRQPNVEGAAAEGVRALRFTSSQQLEQDLRAAGLRF
jgi:FMN phosphatase YigB (HAD superfamily)